MRVDNIGRRVTQRPSIFLLRVTEPKKWSPQGKPREWAYKTEISHACDEPACMSHASMPRRRPYKNQRPAFCWNTEISELRKYSIKQRRKAQRARKRKRPEKQEKTDRYMDARKLFQNAIKQSKRHCWKVLCSNVDRDPWGTPYRL